MNEFLKANCRVSPLRETVGPRHVVVGMFGSEFNLAP